MRTIIRIVLFFATLACFVWVVFRPDYDSVVASFMAVAAFLTSLLLKKSGGSGIEQSQKVSFGSTGIQAGGNVRTDKRGK
jgi:hypothetical protein